LRLGAAKAARIARALSGAPKEMEIVFKRRPAENSFAAKTAGCLPFAASEKII
jgi:hypothetical protein